MSASGNFACIEREEVLTCLVKFALDASILTEGALTEIAASGNLAFTAIGEGLIEISASGSLDSTESEGALTWSLGSGNLVLALKDGVLI